MERGAGPEGVAGVGGFAGAAAEGGGWGLVLVLVLGGEGGESGCWVC